MDKWSWLANDPPLIPRHKSHPQSRGNEEQELFWDDDVSLKSDWISTDVALSHICVNYVLSKQSIAIELIEGVIN